MRWFDGGPTPSEVQTFTVRWSFLPKPDGTPHVCPAAYNHIKIVARASDAPPGYPQQSKTAFGAIAPCEAGSTTMALPVRSDGHGGFGTYNFTAIIVDAEDTTAYQVSLAKQLRVPSLGPQSVDLLVGLGGMKYEVELQKAETAEKLYCAEANVDALRFVLKRVRTIDGQLDEKAQEVPQLRPCADPSMWWTELGYGDYDVHVEALSPRNEVVAQPSRDQRIRIDRESVQLVDGRGVPTRKAGFVVPIFAWKL